MIQILQRSVSGYVFVAPGVLLYYFILKKKQTFAHKAAAFVFCYYLIGVLTMTGIGKIKEFSPDFVLLPFAEMLAGPKEAALNVFLFVPLGFFLPLLYEWYGKISRVAAAGFALSLSVELVQMFGRGATDVNDLITNTVGACCGGCVYRLLCAIVSKERMSRFQAVGIKDWREGLFFAAYAFLVMVTLQPLVIHALFQLG